MPAPDPGSLPARPAPPVRPEPEDRCLRCGRPVAAGVSLCRFDNPGGIRSPSATQVHGTILVGVIVGFIVFALAARFAVAGAGPFDVTVLRSASQGDGGVAFTVRVANRGERPAASTCRISFGAGPSSTDPSFLTDPIPVGQSVDVSRSLPPPESEPAYRLDRLAIRCV
jgi:hypothetical protein